KSQGERVATAECDETLVMDTLAPLAFEDRVELRKIFALPVFRRALKNCRHDKPSTKISRTTLDSALGAIAANNRLHQMRGWEMFEEALFAQTLDPAPKRAVAEDNYKTPV